MILAVTTSVLGLSLHATELPPRALAQARFAQAQSSVPVEEAPLEDDARKRRNMRTFTYLSLGVGVAAAAASLAVGVGMALPRSETYALEADRVGALPRPTEADTTALEELKAESDATTGAAIGLGAASGALLVTSLILFLTTPNAKKPPVALASLMPRKGGADFGVAFQF